MSKRSASVSVSAAADNTRVVKKSKNMLKLDVVNVRLDGGDVRKVRFIAKNKKGGIVICRTKGQPPIRVVLCTSYRTPHFEASVRGQSVVPIGNTPNVAFARAVKEFWS